MLKDKSTLKSEDDAVTVLDGTQEGAYQWVWLMIFSVRIVEFEVFPLSKLA